MLNSTMRAAIDGARTLAHMDELSRSIWQAHSSGTIADDDAQALAELLEVRRAMIREAIVPVGIPPGRPSLFPPRIRQRSPDRAASRDRRRLLACSGPMPPALAARFTEGQRAVLRIVADEIAIKGVCGLAVDAIAARAGVCGRLAQQALRLAAGDGLIVIEERRHQGRKSDPNLVRIISREWSAWIKRGRRADRVKSDSPRGYRSSDSAKSKQSGSGLGATGKVKADAVAPGWPKECQNGPVAGGSGRRLLG